jgi:hypothetical protein
MLVPPSLALHSVRALDCSDAEVFYNSLDKGLGHSNVQKDTYTNRSIYAPSWILTRFFSLLDGLRPIRLQEARSGRSTW